MKNCLPLFLLLMVVTLAKAQGRLVLNGASLVMQNKVYLVIGNGNPDALTITNTSGGITTDSGSVVRWNIGATAGTYTVPYFSGSTYLPISFTTSGAGGSGYFDLNSYAGGNWKNSDYLPPGVGNINRGSSDNSAYVIDRFWRLQASGYSTKPNLSNVSFAYREVEWNAPGNTINESLLKAQRWNDVLSRWDDFAPAGTANVSSNLVTVPLVSASDLFSWWTLVDANFPLPLRLLSFTAQGQSNNSVLLRWTTSHEVQVREFLVERSANGQTFFPLHTIRAIGNSNGETQYTDVDPLPLQGISFYRLKMLDSNGHFSYSNIEAIRARGDGVIIHPNPVKDIVWIHIGQTGTKEFAVHDASGRLLQSGVANAPAFSLNLSQLPAGIYWLRLFGMGQQASFKLLKE